MYTVYEHLFPNGKRYIGITSQNVEKRWQNGNGYATQYFMNLAIQKYGWENIEHNILETGLTQKRAKEIEKYYINKYNTNNLLNGYNRTIGGDSHICKPVIFKEKTYMSLEDFCHSNNLSLKTIGDWLNGNTPMDPYYYDNGLRYQDQEREIIKGKSFRKKVVCNNIIYNSIRDFSRKNNLNAGSVTHWLNGDKGMPEYWFNLGLQYLNHDNSKIKKAVKN